MNSGNTTNTLQTESILIEQVGRMVACLNSCTGNRELIAEIHSILKETFYVDNFYVVMLKESGQLEFPYFVDSIDQFSEDSLNSMLIEDIQATLTFYALTSNLQSNFTKAQIETLQQEGLVKVKGTVPEQWLAFPLQADEASLGAFVIQSYRSSNEYSEEDVKLFSAISHVMSAALQAYRNQTALYVANDELQQHKHYLEEKVQTRTASLAVEKQKLEQEIKARKRLQLDLEDKITQLEAQDKRNQQLQEQLRHQASHDHLTGLANRHELNNVLSRIAAKMVRASRSVYLLFIDLDGFKAVNDTHGHEIGDFLLVEVSKKLQTLVRGYDLIARIGGDEFVVLIEQMEHVDFIQKVALRIVEHIAQPIIISGIEVSIGASVGVAFSHDAKGVASLIINADKAMYQAKALGKNQVAWHETLSDISA